MTDYIEISLIDNTSIETCPEFWEQFPLMKSVLRKEGSNPVIIHFDAHCDTLSSSITEIAPPTTDVANFTTGVNLVLVGDDSGDNGIAWKVIGQKSDGTIEELTTATDAADATTTVDLGTWFTVWTAYPTNTTTTFIGNVFVKDVGITTTYFVYDNTSKTVPKGVIYIPDGYKGSAFSRIASLDTIPGNVNRANYFSVGDSFKVLCNAYNPTHSMDTYGHVREEHEQIEITGKYSNAVTTSLVHGYIACWEE